MDKLFTRKSAIQQAFSRQMTKRLGYARGTNLPELGAKTVNIL